MPYTKNNKDGTSEEKMERVSNPPPSIMDLHRYLKGKGLTISRWSLYDWNDVGQPTEIKEFSQCIKKGISRIYPEILQENAIMGKYAQPFAIFAAKNRMGWHDKQEIDHTHHVEPFIIQNPDGQTLITLGSQVASHKAA